MADLLISLLNDIWENYITEILNKIDRQKNQREEKVYKDKCDCDIKFLKCKV